jgi:hypothetical protein
MDQGIPLVSSRRSVVVSDYDGASIAEKDRSWVRRSGNVKLGQVGCSYESWVLLLGARLNCEDGSSGSLVKHSLGAIGGRTFSLNDRGERA